MNVGVTSAILASVVCSTVAIAILIRRPRLPLYNYFAWFNFSLALWHASSFVGRISGIGIGRVQTAAALWLPSLALLFFRNLLRNDSPHARSAQRLTVIIAILLTVLTFSPWGIHFLVRTPVAAYVIIALSLQLRGLWYHKCKARSETEATRLSYLFYGGLIAFVLALGELIDDPGFPAALGHVAVTFYVYFLHQSVVARRLIDLVELLGKAAVLAALTLVLATVYALLVLWVGSEHQGLWLFNTLVASFVILILYDQVRPRVEEATAKLIFRKHYELHQVTRRLLHALRTTISVEDMCELTLERLHASGRASQLAVYLATDQEMSFQLSGFRGLQPPPVQLNLSTHPVLLNEVRRERRPLLLEYLAHRQEELPSLLTGGDPALQRDLDRAGEAVDAMRELRANVVLPMVVDERIVGLLIFGAITPSEAFTTDELSSLLSVAEACAVVIENSHEYEKRRERDRLAVVGEMATGMAHEIRNPLGAIKGAAQCLDPQSLPEDAQEFIGVIVEEVDRLNKVVGQFLEYARPWRGNPEPTHVNDVIAATVRLLGHDAIPKTVVLEQDLALGLPQVSIDPDQLKQVLINLLLNSIQAMPRGGRILLKTESVRVPPGSEPHALGPKAAQEQVLIRVADSGEGIDAEVINSIFVPFYTTKNQGTGLGLPISQRIVENAGGRIEVMSQRTGGTTFTVRLPSTSASGRREPAPDSTRDPSETSTAAEERTPMPDRKTQKELPP